MTVHATTINKVCLSGLQSLYLADLMIRAGDAEVVASFGDSAPAATLRTVGRGRVAHVALWAGLAYSARVRRAKLYYLRGLKGKAARLRERN